MKTNPKTRIVVNWQPTAGEPSPAWARLWRKLLLTSREDKPASTREIADDGELRSGGRSTTPDKYRKPTIDED